ncbi:MAG TPA: hypothetical protein VNX21_02875, partial [Candidatus Thermoplasmatota archaeon]|nr:hypothetical protein [Candidatus Thermoplasmatota archaeon]
LRGTMASLRRALDVMLVGLLVVILDVRIDGADLLPDPLGFAAAAVGVLLARRGGFPPGWATVAAAAFLVTAVLAVPDVVAPGKPFTGIRVAPRDAEGLAESLLSTSQDAALGAAMMALSLAAAARGAAALARHARWLAVAFGVLIALGLVVDAAWLAGVDDDVLVYALVLFVPSLVAFVLALVLMWRGRDLAPPGGVREDEPPAHSPT